MEIRTLYPLLCKHDSCLARADYEFTDIKSRTTVKKDGLIEEEVSKMLKEIHGDKDE